MSLYYIEGSFYCIEVPLYYIEGLNNEVVMAVVKKQN